MPVTKAELRARIAELEAQVAELNTEVATLTSAKMELQTRNAALNEANVNLTNQVTVLKGEVLTMQATIATLNQQLADCQNPPEPVPVGKTLFGVTVNGGVRKNMPDLHDDVAVSRCFTQGVTNWANEGMHKAFPKGKWACSNSYELSEAELPALLKSIPEADKAKIVAWADGHELEHPDKKLNPLNVKARMRRTAQVIRDHGLKVASCVMGFSIKDDEWLKWIDPDVVDIIAFDKYNSGAKKTPPVYQDPQLMVAEAKKQSIRFGKPFAFWETGTNNFEKPYPAGATQAQKDAIDEANRQERAKRVAWTKAVKAELIKQDAVTAIWFDRPSTSGSSWDATLDRPTAEAWLL